MATDLGNLLRCEVNATGKSRNQVAKETGISQNMMNRFMNGADMRLSHASKLFDYLGLVVAHKNGNGKARKAKAK